MDDTNIDNYEKMMARKLEVQRLEFLTEILTVYSRYGLSLSHEDGHGSFIVDGPSQHNMAWLLDATLSEEAIRKLGASL